MGKELDASHYDTNLSRVGLTLWESPWLSVYAMTAEFLATATGAIMDIGCGTGRFARLLSERNERDYFGFDFSPARIDEACRYTPGMRFEVADAKNEAVRQRFADFERFAILEFLEHIEDDLEMIADIPQGALVVFSVPSYDSAGHVRHFTSVEEVVRRYGELLELDPTHAAVFPLPRRPEKRIFSLAGRRR